MFFSTWEALNVTAVQETQFSDLDTAHSHRKLSGNQLRVDECYGIMIGKTCAALSLRFFVGTPSIDLWTHRNGVIFHDLEAALEQAWCMEFPCTQLGHFKHGRNWRFSSMRWKSKHFWPRFSNSAITFQCSCFPPALPSTFIPYSFPSGSRISRGGACHHHSKSPHGTKVALCISLAVDHMIHPLLDWSKSQPHDVR